MTIHNVADAKVHLSALLDAALKGEDVIVARAGKPLVRLVPMNPPRRQDARLPRPPDARRAVRAARRGGAGRVVVTALLLDTHAYVWALTDPAQLSDRARAAVENPTNTLLVSVATAWEMAIKYRAGKWPEAEILLAQHEDLTDRLGAHRLDISASEAIRAGSLDWDHADPFDRILAAQSLVQQAALVTRDGAFAQLRGLTVVW